MAISASYRDSEVYALPKNVEAAQLQTIDLFKLQSGSETEQARLFEAAVRDGFFYLDMTHPSFSNLLDTASKIHSLSEELFRYENPEKSLFDVDKISPLKVNGYKPKGRNIVNKDGVRDGFESWVLPRNGIMRLGSEAFPHPPAIAAHMGYLNELVNGLGGASRTIFRVLSDKLSLRDGQRFEDFHELSRPSPDVLRLLKYHADDEPKHVPQTPHTDLGSLTFVFSKVPGLQVLPVDKTAPAKESDWVYVAPLPGHAVVNLGDCMSMMTNGTLKSALHRVGPLPGMAMPERYSFAYLMRPEDSTLLRVLDSPLIKRPVGDENASEKAVTSGEWISRKFKALRAGRDTVSRSWQGDTILTGGRAIMTST